MARSTYMTFLMHKASGGGEYSKLIDIKDFPDLGGSPEMLETTTLSDNMQTNIPGIFAAGDCRVKEVRQLTTACADGAVAALAAVQYCS